MKKLNIRQGQRAVHHTHRAVRRAHALADCIQLLESRTLLSTTLLVTNTNDSGPGSLRQAILTTDTVSSVSYDIQFKIGSGAQTINLKTPLPAPNMFDVVTFDGTTQPGYYGTPLIDINGSQISSGNTVGLTANAQDDVIQGLAIDNFKTGISIGEYADSVLVQDNLIGAHSNKTMAIGISDDLEMGGTVTDNTVENCTSEGIYLFSSDFVTVSGNTISHNSTGVLVDAICELDNNQIEYNNGPGVNVLSGVLGATIGLSASTGNNISYNGGNGITIDSNSGAVIGNTIDHNVGSGIDVGSDSTETVTIQTNFITGNANGIYISGTNVQVGGTGAGQGNNIGGNKNAGVYIDASTDEADTASSVIGNTIDSNGTGIIDDSIATIQGNTVAYNSGGPGILAGGSGNSPLIGGYTTGQGNYIHNNTGGGIVLNLAPAMIEGNTISDNDNNGIYILAGTDYALISENQINSNSASGVAIHGSSTTVINNSIYHNGSAGVYVSGASGPGTGQFNTITQNSIYSNSAGGIELVSGANESIAAPVITEAVTYPQLYFLVSEFAGSFSGADNTQYVLEFFATPAPGAHEGEYYIGKTTVTTNSGGMATFDQGFIGDDGGALITATATNLTTGSTSQFSNALTDYDVPI